MNHMNRKLCAVFIGITLAVAGFAWTPGVSAKPKNDEKGQLSPWKEEASWLTI